VIRVDIRTPLPVLQQLNPQVLLAAYLLAAVCRQAMMCSLAPLCRR
jgi:hypothetical protein